MTQGVEGGGYDGVQPQAHTQHKGIQARGSCECPGEGQAVQLGTEGGVQGREPGAVQLQGF